MSREAKWSGGLLGAAAIAYGVAALWFARSPLSIAGGSAAVLGGVGILFYVSRILPDPGGEPGESSTNPLPAHRTAALDPHREAQILAEEARFDEALEVHRLSILRAEAEGADRVQQLRDEEAVLLRRRDDVWRQLPKARLVCPALGIEHQITRLGTTLGRAPGNDLQIKAAQASRIHARIVAGAPGEYRVRDAGSARGLRVNDAVISEAVLVDGGQIEIAGQVIRFELG